MKKAIAILCAVLFSACTQAAQTAPQTSETSAESVTEITTETAATTASQTAAVTTTAVVSSASTTSETSETTDTTAEDATETTETTSETMTEPTTAETSVSAAETSTAVTVDEEKQRILDEMPDIVFVMSYNLWQKNIYGFYVTKTGEIKMYDFRNIAPDETYEIPDVYDRIEEATCEKIIICEDRTFSDTFGAAADGIINQSELISISQEKMIDSFNMLHISHSVGLREVPLLDNDAKYNFYGVLKEKEGYRFIRLGTWGRGVASDYDRSDSNTEELCNEIYGWFPEIPDGFIY